MSEFCATHELTIGDINAPSERLLPALPGWTLKDANESHKSPWLITFDYGIEELAATVMLGGVVVNVVVEGRAAGRGRTSTSNRAAGADEHVAELSASARPRPRGRPGADATIEPHRPLLKLKVGSWLARDCKKRSEGRRKTCEFFLLPNMTRCAPDAYRDRRKKMWLDLELSR
jgi:hypothetical protein